MPGAQTLAELMSGAAAADKPTLPPGFVATSAIPATIPVPKGFTAIPPPPPHTSGQLFQMGLRDVAEGTGSVADMLSAIITVPVNAAAQATGHQPIFTSVKNDVSHGLDRMGVPSAQNPRERITSAIGQGLTAGLVTSGAGGLVEGAGGVAGDIAGMLAQAPIRNALSAGAGGASQQVAAEHGVGPVGQTLAGLIGAGVTFGGLSAAERIRPRITLKGTVASTPREVLIDGEGDLTQEGKEAVVRHGVTTKELKAAYEAPPIDAPVPAEDIVKTIAPEERAQAAPEPVQQPVEGVAPQEVAAAPEAPAASALPANSPEASALRLARAASEGVTLSKGQATQDFGTQVAENDLKATTGPAATQARMFGEQQQQQIGQMVDNLKSAIGETGGTAADRGKVVQDAIGQLRDQGQAGVRALYDHAKEVPGSDLPLDHGGILDAADNLILETPMDQGSKDALERAMAKFGVLPGKVETNGRYASVVTDDGRRILVRGEVTPLTLANAEEFRQALNAAWDQHGLMGKAVRALDDAVDHALESGADGERTAAFKAARKAAKGQTETFKSKDVVADIAGVKAGTQTPKLDPEDVIKKVLGGGKDNITDLKRVKAVLLSKTTEQSKAAWQALKSHAIGEIFDKALSPNGEFSGARLTSAIKQFGPDKLRVLLDPEEFNQLMKVNRVMRDVTVPLANTTNPSGSGYAVIRFMTQHALKMTGTALRVIPGVGHVADAAIGLVKMGKDARIADETLRGMREYTGPKSFKEKTVNPAQFARDFIDVTKSDEILAPLLAAEAQPKEPKQ